MFDALTKFTHRVEIYTVDIEVELEFNEPLSQRRRSIIVPYNIMAPSGDAACVIALAIEKREVREIPKRGEPRVVAIRKKEFRAGW